MSMNIPLRVTADVNSAVSNLDQVAAAERRIGAEARSASREMTEGFNASRGASRDLLDTARQLKDTLFQVTAAFGVTAVVTQFTRGIVDSTNKMQGWRQSFAAAAGDAAKGAAEFEYARSEAERLGISLESSTYSFAKLTAATRGTTLAGQDTRDIFTSIAEASRVLNLGAEQTTGAFRAIEQMVSKGTVQAEELRGQLAERIPGAFQLTASAMGVTTEELNGMLERGEVLASDMLPKLADELKKLYSGPAAQAAELPAANFARLQNAILELQVAIGDAGFMQMLVTGAINLTEALNALVDSGALDGIVSGLILIGQAALIAFAGKAVQSVGLYVQEIIKGVAATSAMSDQQAMMTAQTLKAAEAEVYYTTQRLANIEADRQDLAVTMQLYQAQLLLDKQLAASPPIRGANGRFQVSPEAIAARERLATAEVRLNALNAEAAGLAKLRMVAEQQLSGALAAQTAAQNALTTSLTTGQIVMTKLRSLGAGLFNLIGGWAGVAVAAAYALYSLWEAVQEGEKKARAPITAIEELNEAMREQIRLQDLVTSGKASSDNAAQVSKINDLVEANRKWVEAARQAQEQLQNMGPIINSTGDAIERTLTARMEAAKEKSAEASAQLQEFIYNSVRLGKELPPEFEKIKTSVYNVESQLRSWLPVLEEAILLIPRLSNAEQKFAVDLEAQIQKLEIQKVQFKQGTEAALLREAAYKRAKETGEDVDVAEKNLNETLRQSIKEVANLTRENEALAQAQRERERATRDQERNERRRAESMQALVQAEQKLLDSIDDARSTIDGPMAKAENDWAKRNREIAVQIQTMIQKEKELFGAKADLIRIKQIENEAYEASSDLYQRDIEDKQREIDERKRLGTVVDIGVRSLEDEVAALKMSEVEREIHNALLEAEQQARKDVDAGIRKNIDLTYEEIDAIRARVSAAHDERLIVEASREYANNYKSAWMGAIDDVSSVMSEFIVGNIKSFKDFGQELVNIVKKMVAEMIANFLKMKIIQPMLSGIFGGLSGSLASGASGSVGGNLLSSVFSAGQNSGLLSAAPWLGALGGVGLALNNPANSTGANIGRIGSYGVAGYALGSVAAGALGGASALMGTTAAMGMATGAGASVGAMGAAAAGGAAAGGMTAAAAIPVVGWIIAAIAAIDMITGGKVFGTKYRPESSNQQIAINAEGSSATATMTEVRQRSLFRGRQWRTTNVPASEEAREAAQSLFDSVKGAMVDAARALEIEVPPVIDAAIRTVTEYDKKGKVKSSQIFVDVLGRSFKEANPESAAMRIVAEGILSVLAKSVDSVVAQAKPLVSEETLAKVMNVGGRNRGDGADSDFPGGGGGGGAIGQTQTYTNEIHNIAERWRKDAEMLLEGAQFLLAAQQQILKGNNLLGDSGTLTEITNLVEEMQRGEETLSQTFARLLAATDLFELALNSMGVEIGVTGEEFVKLASDIADAAGGLEQAAALWNDYLGGFFNIEEQAQTALAAAEATKDRLMEGLGLATDITAEEFRTQFEAALPTLSPEEIVRWLEASRALKDVDRAIEVIHQQALELAGFTQSIADAVFDQEATEFERAVMQIRRQTTSYIADANALARSRGQEGASARDLALIHRWAANEYKKAVAALEDSVRNLVDQLGYGPLATIEAQIAALEASLNVDGQMEGISNVGDAAEDLFAQWEAGIKSLREYVDSLLVGELSPLSKEEQLNEARNQLDEALAAAQAGNIDALNSIPQLADQFFRQLRDWEASGMDYSGVVQQYIDQFNALGANPYSPLGPTGPSTPSSVPLVPSEELLALYAERDRITAEQDAASRLAMALELAGYLEELARATGETVFEAAERMGINFAQFVTDLGGNVGAETAEAVAALGDVANTLSVELPELADQLGLALGQLNDTQSLLNDAFEFQLNGLPEEFRNQLEPLLRAVEQAAGPEQQVAAIDALEEATNALPEEFRLQLAPYLSGVDPITPDLANELDYLSDLWAEAQQANVLLNQIKNELILANGNPIPKNQESNLVSPKYGSFAGDTLNTVRSASAEANTAMVYEMQQMRAEQERMRAELKAALERLGNTNEKATRDGADKVASSVDNLARNGIVTRTG